MSIAPLVCERKQTVSLTGRRMRGFYLEISMKDKTCLICKKSEPLEKFYLCKTGCYNSYCKSCTKNYQKNYQKEYIVNHKENYHRRKKHYRKYPWIKSYLSIKRRCIYYEKSSYFKRGIKNFLTTGDLKILWFRDKGYLMKRPSIDRINSKKHYTFDNCRYMEFMNNIRKPVHQLNLQGKILQRYDSVTLAAKYINVSTSKMSETIKKDTILSDFKWRLVDDKDRLEITS